MTVERKNGQVAQKTAHSLGALSILAVISAALYGFISFLSWRFKFDSPETERPIVAVLFLFALALAAYLYAICLVRGAHQDRRLLWLIIGAAVLFRVTLLFSIPIQEVDIYRYLWDGAVAAEGVSPFRYSPVQVRLATANSTSDEELARLVRMRDQQPSVAEVLRRVHFSDLPTIYPPTSQVVFYLANLTTPRDASVYVRVILMKALLIGFDVATIFLVLALLRLSRQPDGLCLIYAWCPLLLKEVANSGHLDAIAVFFTTLAVYLVARLFSPNRLSPDARSVGLHTTLAAVVLAAGVGAKLYPVVLAPLAFLVVAKRFGWRRVILPMAAFAATTILVLWPMMPRNSADMVPPLPSDATTVQDVPPVPTEPGDATAKSDTSDPSLGLLTFLRRWEMNAFIFMVIIENIKPTSNLPPDRVAWFAVTPEWAREQTVSFLSERLAVPVVDAPFLLTRAMTAILFAGLALWFAWRTANKSDIASFCEAGFLTLAWFWLLCPTQNPWYWTWVMPLLPFARSRAWLAVSGIVLVYYLRFWFGYHWDGVPILGTLYSGQVFFDFVVTWLEFAPWFVWLASDSILGRQRDKGPSVVTADSIVK